MFAQGRGGVNCCERCVSPPAAMLVYRIQTYHMRESWAHKLRGKQVTAFFYHLQTSFWNSPDDPEVCKKIQDLHVLHEKKRMRLPGKVICRTMFLPIWSAEGEINVKRGGYTSVDPRNASIEIHSHKKFISASSETLVETESTSVLVWLPRG